MKTHLLQRPQLGVELDVAGRVAAALVAQRRQRCERQLPDIFLQESTCSVLPRLHGSGNGHPPARERGNQAEKIRRKGTPALRTSERSRVFSAG